MKETTEQLLARAVDAIEAADILLTNEKTDIAAGRAYTGIDLLVIDKKNKTSLSIQVKFSRDFLVTNLPAEVQGNLPVQIKHGTFHRF